MEGSFEWSGANLITLYVHIFFHIEATLLPEHVTLTPPRGIFKALRGMFVKSHTSFVASLPREAGACRTCVYVCGSINNTHHDDALVSSAPPPASWPPQQSPGISQRTCWHLCCTGAAETFPTTSTRYYVPRSAQQPVICGTVTINTCRGGGARRR